MAKTKKSKIEVDVPNILDNLSIGDLYRLRILIHELINSSPYSTIKPESAVFDWAFRKDIFKTPCASHVKAANRIRRDSAKMAIEEAAEMAEWKAQRSIIKANNSKNKAYVTEQ